MCPPRQITDHRIQAHYFDGNMTDTLTFRYTVVEGDETGAFDILDTRTNKRQTFSTAFIRPAVAEVCIEILIIEWQKATTRLAVETVNQHNSRDSISVLLETRYLGPSPESDGLHHQSHME